MADLKHTPGPWLVANSNSWRRIVSSHDGNVCEPITQRDGHPDLHFRNGGENGPDARLLVASPDMLDALKAVLSDIHEYQGTISLGTLALVSAAIAKAEGGNNAG
ncbi:hypothetical protein [Mesorhizobium sp. Z1-4]|uniref:hypothetical protein n=1 Tax=Mesorhizobium sp. Z1-4 TaxID=2448478 RepID=UPI000FDBA610|nr:hypothetical protein [Mesorhizobium sp. Z1-4]